MALFDMFKRKGGAPQPEKPEPQPEIQPEPTAAEVPVPEPSQPVAQNVPEPETQPQSETGEAAQESAPAEPERPLLTAEQTRALQEVLNRTYPGVAMLVRDVDLTYEQASKYEVGMILREPAYVDATRRVMGMVTSHRYAILSNHMLEPTTKELEQGANWGLRVANKGSRFRVLGKHTYQGKTVIFLLHLPDDDGWKLFTNAVIDSDEALIAKCKARFEAKCLLPPVEALASPEWMDRCRFPIGMDNYGNLYDLE